MQAPLVVVELPQGHASGAEAATLVEACSSALRPDRCALTNDATERGAAAIALVSFTTEDHLRARIEVGGQRAERQIWLSDELTFRPQDAPTEQYRTLGLAIAVLYRELVSGTSTRVHTEPPPNAVSLKPSPPRPVESRPAPSAKEASERETAPPRSPARAVLSPPRAWLGAGGFVQSEAGLGAARLGGQASLGVTPVRPLLLGASARYLTAKTSQVALTFVSVGIGAGIGFPVGAELTFRTRLEVRAENIAANATDPTTGAAMSRSYWAEGLGLDLDAVWSPSPWWGFCATVGAEQLSRAATVTLYGKEVGTTATLSYGAGLGLEVHPFDF